jgi:hypothetical protein
MLRGLGASLSSTDLPDGLDARMDRPFGTIVLVEKPLCAKTNFLSVFNVIWLVQRSRKNIPLYNSENQKYIHRRPVPLRGAARDVTDAGRDAAASGVRRNRSAGFITCERTPAC